MIAVRPLERIDDRLIALSLCSSFVGAGRRWMNSSSVRSRPTESAPLSTAVFASSSVAMFAATSIVRPSRVAAACCDVRRFASRTPARRWRSSRARSTSSAVGAYSSRPAGGVDHDLRAFRNRMQRIADGDQRRNADLARDDRRVRGRAAARHHERGDARAVERRQIRRREFVGGEDGFVGQRAGRRVRVAKRAQHALFDVAQDRRRARRAARPGYSTATRSARESLRATRNRRSCRG